MSSNGPMVVHQLQACPCRDSERPSLSPRMALLRAQTPYQPTNLVPSTNCPGTSLHSQPPTALPASAVTMAILTASARSEPTVWPEGISLAPPSLESRPQTSQASMVSSLFQVLQPCSPALPSRSGVPCSPFEQL